MTSIPSEAWPWLTVAALGLYHGVNPAMGWLFAVAIGLHRQSQRAVLLSLFPICIGHAAAAGLVAIGTLMLGLIVDLTIFKRLAGLALLGFAGWRVANGGRHRLRVGMQTGLTGLVLWSFLMANVHGVGLMLIPALLPVCLAASPTGALVAGKSIPVALTVLTVHMGAMLATISVVSVAVYNWIGIGLLRRGWVNLDLLWAGALVICGVALVAASW